MKIFLSPSKTMNLNCLTLPTAQQPRFLEQSHSLINELRKLSVDDIAEFMNISDKLANAVHDYIDNWKLPFTNLNAKPALFTFSGDVYEGLDAQKFSETELAYAQQNIRILSGLYGILRPLDLIQPYRLEMGKKLSTGKVDNLYKFWGNILTESINEECRDFVINLASREYFKVIRTKELKPKVITPVFKDTSKGKLKIISFYAKRARGLMARYIVENRIDDIEAIKGFNKAGYKFSEELSKENEFIFTRPEQK